MAVWARGPVSETVHALTMKYHWRKGARAGHTEECRARFRGILSSQAKVRNAEVRRKEFEEKVEERRREER